MQRRRYISALGAAGIGALAGCTGGNDSSGGNGSAGTSTGNSSDDSSKGSIKVGALEPLSGPFGPPFADPHLRGLKLAVEDINNSDAIDRDLQVLTTDTKSDPAEAASAFQRNVEQNDVVAVTGAVSSDVGIRLARTAEEVKVPNFLNQAGSGKVLNKDSRYTFRVGWLPGQTHVRSDMDLIESRDINKIGAIVGDYAWGHAVKSTMEEQIPDSIEMQIEVAPLGASDFKSYLRNLPNDMDLLSVLGHPAGAVTATQQLFDIGMGGPLILGVDVPQKLGVQVLGENLTRNILARHMVDVESSEFKDLGQRYGEKYDVPMYVFSVFGYVTGRLIGESISNVGTDPVAIADYIRKTTFDFGLYNEPIRYTEWGELDQPVHAYSKFVAEPPSYYQNGKYRLNPVEKSSALAPYVPESSE